MDTFRVEERGHLCLGFFLNSEYHRRTNFLTLVLCGLFS